MSVNQTFNNVVYPIPTQGDPAPWGPALDRYLIALGTYAISPAGGSYPLTADLNLGGSFGVIAKDFSTHTALPATAGLLRMAKTDTIEWRNNANSGDNILAIDGSDNLTYNGSIIVAGLGVLPSGDLFVGSAGNVPVAQPLSGDATLVASGALTIANGAITNAKVNNSAAIAYSKLSLTSSIVNADISNSAAIAYSKLALSNSIVNADIASAAAIAVSKLAALTVSKMVSSDGSGFLTTTDAFVIGSNGPNGILVGTNTNDSASAGQVGEYISSYVTNVAAAATSVRGNITSISLTAGDWDVSGNAIIVGSAGTFSEPNEVILSAFSGNTATDEQAGDNASYFVNLNAVTASYGACVPAWRVLISGTTTIYLKGLATYSAGSPTWDGRISARRVR